MRRGSALFRCLVGCLLGLVLAAPSGNGEAVAVPAARGPGKRPAQAAAPAAAPDSAATENAIPDSLLRPGLQIPEPLRPWVPWVLHGKESLLCPFLHDQNSDDESGSQTCVWPARLKLALRDKGGSFTQSFFVYKQQWVLLPGDNKAWPQEVRVDGQAAVVASPTHSEDGEVIDDSDSARPLVLLRPGQHVISGSFFWDELPESLQVPKATGLLELTVRNAAIPQPTRDEAGRVFLQKTSTAVEEDVLEPTVHRQVIDEIPLLLRTRIELRVSGKSREVILGKTLPEGFIPMSLDSQLPARLEPDSRLRVQVRPGTYTLTLTARHDGPVKQLRRPDPGGTWAETEAWVFAARPDFRIVTVEGVAAIDPQQTTLPDDWKKLPCYPMKVGDTMQLNEQRRGDSDPVPDRLTLDRNLYLDFDGQGFTVSDRITGSLSRTWRLEVSPSTELGRVAVAGKDQLITRGKTGTGLAGVELRQGSVRIEADSRILREAELPAVSWNADFHSVSGKLHLPPGWRLLHASGADDVPGTWLRHYTLLDLFLVLVVAMAVTRLFGVGWGALALLTLALLCPERDAPRLVWLLVLALEALRRVLPAGKLTGVLRLAMLGSRVVLVLLVVSFGLQQLRHGMYPQLERPGEQQVDAEMTANETGYFDRSVASDSAGQVMGGLGNLNNAPAGIPMKQEAGENQLKNDFAPMDDKPSPKKRGILESKEQALEQDQVQQRVMAMKVPAQMQIQGNLSNMDYRMNSRGGKLGYKGRSQAWESDPNAIVQTGPGMPRWRWNTISIGFSGPVEKGQTLRLWLIPPRANSLLAVVQVLLLALLTVLLCGVSLRMLRGKGAQAATMVLLALLFSGGEARAELPSKEILEELQQRILKQPECRPHCASSPRLQLEIFPKMLRARMEVGAAAATAIPLPGDASQWLPEQVLLDGAPAAALMQHEEHLWLALPAGSHIVQLEGRLASRETVQIALPLKAHRVEAKVDGWQLEGLHEDGLADDNLQLTRVQTNRSEGPAALQPGALPPLVRVEREVQLGLLWEVDTRVVRQTPTGSAVVLEVPLLPGESITSADVRVQNGKALVNMGPTVSEVSWHSLLQEKPQLELVAAKTQAITEVWKLAVSPIFHVELSGIPAVHQQDSSGTRLPEWRPWPGELVRAVVSRPEGVTGRTLTVDHCVLKLNPGLRTTDAGLSLRLRSSRGGPHSLTLPEGAQVQTLTINGQSQPIQRDGRRLQLQLSPGTQNVALQWRQPGGISTSYRTPEIDLGVPSVNVELLVQLGAGRWTLLCSGPRLGPAVLFWSVVLALVLLSLALGQIRWTPLRAHHFLLLGLGLTQASLEGAAIMMLWPLLLGWREQRPELPREALFNLRQLILVGWTMAAMMVLMAAIREGLLGRPDMQVSGNGSTSDSLRWFADRADGPLPQAQIISVPLLVYRGAMLLWALWIAGALLSWLRWAYGAFSAGGLWRQLPPWTLRKKSATAASEGAAEASVTATESDTSDAETAAQSSKETARH